jgi:hypothetical protein
LKFKDVGEKAGTASRPVPLSAIIAGEFVALLATVTLAPLTAPAVLGANVTVSVPDWPGVRTVPFETPLALNPAPATVTPEIVTFEFPVFVNDVVSELAPPTFTFPNERLAGFSPSSKVVAWPVPDKLIVSEEGLPLLVNVMEPVSEPADAGLNVASNVALPPAGIIVEVVRPDSLKPRPDRLICENISEIFPLFVSVMGRELEFPIATVPKLTLVGLAAI